MSATQQNRLRDLAVYVGAALLLLGTIVFLATYSGEHNIDDWRVFQFVAAVVSALLIVGYAAKHRWELRRQGLFWTVLVLFVVVHIAGWSAVVAAAGKIRWVWYLLAAPVEFWPLIMLLDRLPGAKKSPPVQV